MLRHLHIQHYVLIEHLDLDLFPGFNIITGETGAGKSILLGALGLILGARADSAAIKQGAEQCVVEATFDVKGYGLEAFFDAEDMEYADELIVRRQVATSGKSRAFINDTPVTLSQLKALGERLIDIHSQHANLLLQDAPFQGEVLDSFADNAKLLTDYGAWYLRWTTLQHAIAEKVREHQQLERERENLAERLADLHGAKLQLGEVEQLEERQRTLAHAEELALAYSEGLAALEGDRDGALLTTLKEARAKLAKVCAFHPHAAALVERLEGVTVELHDLAQEMAGELKDFPEDSHELEAVEERLALLLRLQKKYHCKDCEELIALTAATEEALSHLDGFDFELEELRAQLASVEKDLRDLADQLTKKRQAAAPRLASEIEESLRKLGIPEAKFVVELLSQESLTTNGAELVEFRFAAAQQLMPQPLARIASGGEMARVMLSLKAIMAHSQGLPTIIFDEIDTGVSGAVAAQMGVMLERMATDRQILNITHLPQIAARGTHHFFVYKAHSESGETVSHIRLLSEEERVQELAKLLSGEAVTEASLENARELLRNAQR